MDIKPSTEEPLGGHISEESLTAHTPEEISANSFSAMWWGYMLSLLFVLGFGVA